MLSPGLHLPWMHVHSSISSLLMQSPFWHVEEQTRPPGWSTMHGRSPWTMHTTVTMNSIVMPHCHLHVGMLKNKPDHHAQSRNPCPHQVSGTFPSLCWHVEEQTRPHHAQSRAQCPHQVSHKNAIFIFNFDVKSLSHGHTIMNGGRPWHNIQFWIPNCWTCHQHSMYFGT